MNKSTLTAIGAALIALGQELVGAEASTQPAQETPESPATPEPVKPRRGRPPADAAPAAPAPETEKEKPATPAGAKTEDELRALCTPLIGDGRGEEVKKLLTKYGGNKFADLPAANHAAFVRDIEALTM
jgi:predicted flap endonuclease-1-like 5' DNA nuclease